MIACNAICEDEVIHSNRLTDLSKKTLKTVQPCQVFAEQPLFSSSISYEHIDHKNHEFLRLKFRQIINDYL